MEFVYSVNSIPIRLTSERWIHIVENHDELAGRFHEVLEAVGDPYLILKGKQGELLAVKLRKFLAFVAVYKEVSSSEGFIITAFETSKGKQLIKTRKIVWQKRQ